MEYNCNLILKREKNSQINETNTKVLGPIIAPENSEKQIISELIMQGFLASKNVYLQFLPDEVLVISKEDDLPLIQMIPMV